VSYIHIYDLTLLSEMIIKMINKIQAVLSDDQGQGMAEYGLILALVAVVAAASFTALEGGIKAALNLVITALGGTTV
jgi:pilus assembly protein Flp/PilA